MRPNRHPMSAKKNEKHRPRNQRIQAFISKCFSLASCSCKVLRGSRGMTRTCRDFSIKFVSVT